MSNVLVVYCSRSGTTQAAAKHVADTLGADLEEITEARDRLGVLGYVRSGFEAFFHRLPEIGAARHDVRKYELVVIGTPIWNASLASPMRSWLMANRRGIKELAVLLTCGGMGMERVLRQIQQASLHNPCAQTVLTDRDRAQGADQEKLGRFEETLRLRLMRAVPERHAAE